MMVDVGVVGLDGEVEGDHPARVQHCPVGVVVVDGRDHPAMLLRKTCVVGLGGALGHGGPDDVLPPGPGEQAVADDSVRCPAGRGCHQLVERAEQDGRVDAAEHGRAHHRVDLVELPLVAHPLPVFCLQPRANGADQVGHPRDRTVGGHAEPVAVDTEGAGAEAEENPPGGAPPRAADPGRVRVGGAGERVGDAGPDLRPFGQQRHLRQGGVRLVVDELAAAERGDAGRLGRHRDVRAAPRQAVLRGHHRLSRGSPSARSATTVLSTSLAPPAIV
jgi:hypothetical protein